MGSRLNKPGNIAVGVFPDNLLHSIDSVSRDAAVGALAGLEDIFRFALLNIVEQSIGPSEPALLQAPYDLKIVHVQFGVITTGTAGTSSMDLEVDGSSVLATTLDVPFTASDETLVLRSLDVDVSKDSIIRVPPVTPATGASGFGVLLYLQRTGRAGGVGIPT